jgi:hypothetical protein
MDGLKVVYGLNEAFYFRILMRLLRAPNFRLLRVA